MKNSFTVSPMSQKIQLKPGETYRGSIMVANPAAATEDFYYKVEINPFTITGDDYETDFETMSDWSRIVSWTEIDEGEEAGVLKPNQDKRINFTITVPENAPGGGQYLMLGVSSNNPINEAAANVVHDVFEMASLIYAEVAGDIKHEGRIIENTIPGFVTTGVPAASTKLSNTGNVHETATVAITMKNVFTGEIIYPKDGEDNTYEVTVMPESTRTSYRNLADLPVLGAVEITEEVSYLGETMGTTTTMILCPLWFMLLILATIASVFGMIFYGKHLKKQKLKKLYQEEPRESEGSE